MIGLCAHTLSLYTRPTLKGYRSTYNNIIKAWALAGILCLLIWQQTSCNACLCGSNCLFFHAMVQNVQLASPVHTPSLQVFRFTAWWGKGLVLQACLPLLSLSLSLSGRRLSGLENRVNSEKEFFKTAAIHHLLLHHARTDIVRSCSCLF